MYFQKQEVFGPDIYGLYDMNSRIIGPVYDYAHSRKRTKLSRVVYIWLIGNIKKRNSFW